MNAHLHTPIISLFSGVGGIDRGVHAAMRVCGLDPRTLAFVERDSFAASVLVARMEESALDTAPVCDDVDAFPSREFAPYMAGGIVTCGFPCQPVSVAGKRAGQQDERWLWDDVLRIANETGAEWIFAENVPGLLTARSLAEIGDVDEGEWVYDGADGPVDGPFASVLGSLAEAGFDAEWLHISAAEIGANHKRERFFMLAKRRELRRDKRMLTGGMEGAKSEAYIAGNQWERDRAIAGGGSADMADSGLQHGQLQQRGTWGKSAGGGIGLADSGEQRLEEWRRQPGDVESQRTAIDGNCFRVPARTVGDGAGIGRGEMQRAAPGERQDAAERCAELPATLDNRPSPRCDETRRGPAALQQGGECLPASGCVELPRFAPGRNDYWGWVRVLSIDPTLVPALPRPNRGGIPSDTKDAESALRRIFDGLEAGLDGLLEFRADRLRCCGNGVVSECAFVAFVELWRRFNG